MIEIIETDKANKIQKTEMVNLIVENMHRYIKLPSLKYVKTKSISNKMNKYIILLLGKEMIGFIMYRIEKDGIFMYEIHTKQQGKGYGKMLVDRLKMINNNSLKISLCAYKENLRAIKFYEREGFVIDNDFKCNNAYKLVYKFK